MVVKRGSAINTENNIWNFCNQQQKTYFTSVKPTYYVCKSNFLDFEEKLWVKLRVYDEPYLHVDVRVFCHDTKRNYFGFRWNLNFRWFHVKYRCECPKGVTANIVFIIIIIITVQIVTKLQSKRFIKMSVIK